MGYIEIQFIYFLDEKNYSLVLEYADGGTLGEHLENNATTLRWESKLKFAKEISSAILCLHDNKIVHRDLVSFIYLYYKLTYMYLFIHMFLLFSIPVIS